MYIPYLPVGLVLVVSSHKTVPYAVNSRNLEAGKVKYPHVICKGHLCCKENFDLWCKVVHCLCVIKPPPLFTLQSDKIRKLLRLITVFLREFVMCAKNVAVIYSFNTNKYIVIWRGITGVNGNVIKSIYCM